MREGGDRIIIGWRSRGRGRIGTWFGLVKGSLGRRGEVRWVCKKGEFKGLRAWGGDLGTGEKEERFGMSRIGSRDEGGTNV